MPRLLQPLFFLLMIAIPGQGWSKAYQKKKYDASATSEQLKAERAAYYLAFRERANKDLSSSLTDSQKNLILDALINFKDFESNQKYDQSHDLILGLLKQFPEEPLVLWHVANSFYTQNSRVNVDDKEKRIAILEKGMEYAEKCVKIAPEDGNCWLGWVALHGRTAALKGVFASLFAVHDLYIGMQNAYDLSDNGKFYQNGPRSTNHETATFALIEFYRALPDSRVIEWITKHRGDPKKAYELAKTLKSQSILNSISLGKAAMCWGAKNDDQAIVDEGIASMRKGIDLELSSNVEEEEYGRIATTLSKIDALSADEKNFENYEKIGCTDYGNDDKDAEAAAQKKK